MAAPMFAVALCTCVCVLLFLHTCSTGSQLSEGVKALRVQMEADLSRARSVRIFDGQTVGEALVIDPGTPPLPTPPPPPPARTEPLVNPEIEDLVVTYESCQESLRGKSSTKTLPSFQWIHIPKTGTSFGYTLFSYVCTNDVSEAVSEGCSYCGPNVRRGIWDRDLYSFLPFTKQPLCDKRTSFNGLLQNHFPVPRQYTAQDNFIGLFRDPRKRLVSAYNHDKHSFGIGQRHPETAVESREYMVLHTQTLRDFADFEDIKSCQTKMLLSEYCAIEMNVTEADAKRAIQILSDFRFVGLTDNFNASICLFHHMFGGPLQSYEFESFRIGKSFQVICITKTYKHPFFHSNIHTNK